MDSGEHCAIKGRQKHVIFVWMLDPLQLVHVQAPREGTCLSHVVYAGAVNQHDVLNGLPSVITARPRALPAEEVPADVSPSGCLRLVQEHLERLHVFECPASDALVGELLGHKWIPLVELDVELMQCGQGFDVDECELGSVRHHSHDILCVLCDEGLNVLVDGDVGVSSESPLDPLHLSYLKYVAPPVVEECRWCAAASDVPSLNLFAVCQVACMELSTESGVMVGLQEPHIDPEVYEHLHPVRIRESGVYGHGVDGCVRIGVPRDAKAAQEPRLFFWRLG